jgi:hypothetical protein
MKIIFTDLFKNECKIKFKIEENIIQQAITDPNAKNIVKLDDKEFIFLIKKLPELNNEYLLVCTRKEANKLMVDLAFRILPELVEEARTLEPIIILQQLAMKFGLTIRIGPQLNKFIFKESIPIESSIKTQSLVEIHNPEKHKFIQNILLKVDKKNKLAICALAFCIDVDKYMSWLIGKRFEDEVFIELAPQIRGQVVPQDLMASSGTLTFWMDSSQLGKITGYLFKVITNDYHFEVGFTKTDFYIIRNGQKLELSLKPYLRAGKINCYAIWRPNELSLLILDESFGKAISSGSDLDYEIAKRKKILKTPPTFPPNSLIIWARKKAIIPTTEYDSESHFYEEVISALLSIQDKVRIVGMFDAFWDTVYENRKIISRKPKKESSILPTIHGLLFDIAIAKNFQILPEFLVGGGRLDFLISGVLKTKEIVSVCVEFKHAHSSKLLKGLLKQLPKYMQVKGVNFGVYCVLFFKGPFFKKPEKYDLKDIKFHLDRKALKSGLKNIRILVFDLSYSIPPSRM